MSNLKNEIDQALRVRDSQQTVAREAQKHASGMWLGAGRKRARNEEACRCGDVSAWGEDMRMDAGGRRGGRGAGVEGSGVKHCEGQWPRGKTEPNMQLSLFLLQIVKIENDNRIRTTEY